MEYKFKATPMARRTLNTERIMLRLFIGLLVVYAYGLYNAYLINVGCLINAILLLVVSLVVGTITEVIFALATKQKPLTFLRKSFHYITCLILVLTVPPYTSLYAMAIATFVALFFGKLVFGGFGQNVFNPAGVGRAIIATSFAGMVTADALTSPTIATAFAGMNWVGDARNYLTLLYNYNGLGSLLLGRCTGAIGESFIIVIIVGIFLAIFDVIDWRIPATYIGIIFAGSWIIGISHGLGIDYALAFTASGGVAFGGVFMLTDPVTNPQTRPGKIVFSAIAALLTVLIRFLGNLPEGVVFSILLVNMLAPSIDIIFSSKQVVAYKRNLGIVFGTIAAVIIIISCVGIFAEPKEYKTSANINTTNMNVMAREVNK